MQPAQFLVCTADDLSIGFWLGVIVALAGAAVLLGAFHLLFGPNRHD